MSGLEEAPFFTLEMRPYWLLSCTNVDLAGGEWKVSGASIITLCRKEKCSTVG